MTTWIYHEKQLSSLCGQHCLNNLVQDSYFDISELSAIANELDSSESQLTSNHSYTKNVDEAGNFSLQVLNVALSRNFNLELTSWTSEESQNRTEYTESAFIINTQNHWYTIRNIRGTWWNLNSFNKKPEFISDFYLNVLLGQLRYQGELIFLVTGPLPTGGEKKAANSYTEQFWYKENDLLPFSQQQQSRTIKSNQEGNDGEPMDEDLQLALAISQSLEPSQTTSNLSSLNFDSLLSCSSTSFSPSPLPSSSSTASSIPTSDNVLPSLSERERIRMKRLQALDK